MIIEPFNFSDDWYEQAVAIQNACYPEYPDVAADWVRWDRKRNPEHMFHRFIVRTPQSEHLIGVGTVMHRSWAHHPRRFYVDGYVLPEYWGRGIGKRMYAYAMEMLEPLRPISIDADTREDRTRSVRFLEERGFELKTREHTSELDLNTFDPGRWAGLIDKVDASGIVVKSLPEVRRDDPDYARKLYDLVCETEQDIPFHGTFTPDPFALWLSRFEDAPNRIEDAYLLALDGDRYIGLTMLLRSRATDRSLYTGFTAVRRPYRRRGIATALKVRSLAYAKENIRTSDGEAPRVMTENEVNNPMYQINVQLGFKQTPDWLMYMKTLEAEEADDASNAS